MADKVLSPEIAEKYEIIPPNKPGEYKLWSLGETIDLTTATLSQANHFIMNGLRVLRAKPAREPKALPEKK